MIKTKAKANYYQLAEARGKKCLLIEDLDQGGRSVTNDIENVVADIAEQEGIDPDQHLIIYKDTDNYWCGWDHSTQSFVLGILERTWEAALQKYIARLG